MPGMTGCATGLEFAARIRILRADLPVVLLSGHSIALTTELIKSSGVREVMSKPYTAEMLASIAHRHIHPPPAT